MRTHVRVLLLELVEHLPFLCATQQSLRTAKHLEAEIAARKRVALVLRVHTENLLRGLVWLLVWATVHTQSPCHTEVVVVELVY